MNVDSATSPRSRRLSFSAVSLLIHEGDIRYVRVGSCEVLRRIYVAVRDAAWGTIPGNVRGYSLKCGVDEFTLTYNCEHGDGPIRFRWDATIEGRMRHSSGGVDCTITFTMDGEALSTFKTNRTGICVLHPIAGCAGAECRIVHPASEETSAFPRLIEPQPIFTDISAMSYSVDGLSVSLRFDGEIFETEDQRNWADTSFKTYCRPLSWGIPYELNAGQRVRQQVTLVISGQVPTQPQRSPMLKIGQKVMKLPSIGLRVADGRAPDSEQLQRLRALNLGHLRVDLRMDRPDVTKPLASAIAQSNALAVPLEMAIHLSNPEAQLTRLTEFLRQHDPRIARFLIYRVGRPTTPRGDLEMAKELLNDRRVPIGGGTIGNFSEVNRDRGIAADMDVLAWGISPQVHAMDDLSLIENLAAQADTVRTARGFAGKAALIVSPVVLHRRPDPFAAGKTGHEEPPPIDPRQNSRLAAAWTLGSIKYLAEADAVTIHETVGPWGVMDFEGGGSGDVAPLYEVLNWIGAFAGTEGIECTSSDPLSIEGLLLASGERRRLMIANMTHEPIAAKVDGGPLNGKIVDLKAYEVRSIDFEE